MGSKTPRWLALSLFIFSLFLYFPSLESPNRLFWDETIHVKGARELLFETGPHKEQMHPPLGREILAASVYLFGDTPGGARVLSVLAGAGSIALLFLIAFQMTVRIIPSLIPPILLWLDPLFFIHARIGMLDIFVTFFILLSFLIFLKILQKAPRRQSIFVYYLLGVCLGLAFAIKTLAVVFYPIFFGVLAWGIWKNPRGGPVWPPATVGKSATIGGQPHRAAPTKAGSYRIQILHLALAFILPTLIIFYIPYALIGFSLTDMKDHLVWYWDFMRTFKGHPGVMSRWYEWLRVYQPIWYQKDEVDALHSATVVATGNYLFWYSAELLFVVTLFLYKRLPKVTYILHAIIVAQFAFWAIKPTTHLYYMLTILPFYALMVAIFFNFLWEHFPEKKKYLLFDGGVYLACCLFIFAYYFPLIRGLPIERARVDRFLFPGTDSPGLDLRSNGSHSLWPSQERSGEINSTAGENPSQ